MSTISFQINNSTASSVPSHISISIISSSVASISIISSSVASISSAAASSAAASYASNGLIQAL